MMWIKILLFIFLSLLHASETKVTKKIPRIGIIGGGLGGTACAWFLKSLFGKTKIEIDLFEAEKIGGRLSVVDFSNKLYEEGGSIIHERNKYMVNFLKEFNYKRRQPSNGYFGLYDGRDFVFTESNWQIKTLWDIILRYGFGFWKLRNDIEDMLNKFDRIYDLQNNGETFETVGSLLAAMDPKFVEYLHVSTKHGFEQLGISDVIIDEVIMATIRANYGQDVNIQKMVGSVSVAGAFGNLWAVHGGNYQIPESLLKASKAKLIRRIVTTVRKLPTGQIQIGFNASEPETDGFGTYDVVVLAAPQTSDAKYPVDFRDFGRDIEFPGRYHKTVCTLVEGKLSTGYFRRENSEIDEILTVKDGLLFNSIGRITPVDYSPATHLNKSNVWKVFTQERLDDVEVALLFSDVKRKYAREWLAYPHYQSQRPVQRNNTFVLDANLYYVNAIEWAASAMEMSAIGAKNVALLTYKNLMSKSEANAPNDRNVKSSALDEL